MTNMNPYDNNQTDTVDIPDFVEDKTTDSISIDKSIFKMSDEELYDDVPNDEEKQDKPKRSSKKKSSATIILCLVVIGVLLLTSVVGLIYALKEHKSAQAYATELTQVKAQNADLQNNVSSLNNQIATLNAQIEEMKNAGNSSDPNNKYPSGTVLYITEDGGNQGVRVTASVDADTATDSDGTNIVKYWGDKVTLTGDATVDADGNYWGKIDTGFIRIEYDGEIWATTEEQ